MQRRLRRWATIVVVRASDSEVLMPLSTLDPPVFQPEAAVDLEVVPDPPDAVPPAAEPGRDPPPAIEPR